MKIKKILIPVLALSLVFTGCQNNEKKEEQKNNAETVVDIESGADKPSEEKEEETSESDVYIEKADIKLKGETYPLGTNLGVLVDMGYDIISEGYGIPEDGSVVDLDLTTFGYEARTFVLKDDNGVIHASVINQSDDELSALDCAVVNITEHIDDVSRSSISVLGIKVGDDEQAIIDSGKEFHKSEDNEDKLYSFDLENGDYIIFRVSGSKVVEISVSQGEDIATDISDSEKAVPEPNYTDSSDTKGETEEIKENIEKTN